MPTPMTPSTFTSLLTQYDSTHRHRHARKPAPHNVCDCAFRFTTAAALVASRRQQQSGKESDSDSSHPCGYLSVDEVARLVEWKIHHGSFFPALPQLARANDAQAVKAVTGEAFALIASTSTSTTKAEAGSGGEPDAETVMAALAVLTRLRGVGPATASLLLSVAEQGASIPFFADELFLWASVGFEGEALPGKKSVKIKYSVKEYEELLRNTRAFLGRMKQHGEGEAVAATAKDVEMVARVLGARSDGGTGEGQKRKGEERGEVGVGEGGNKKLKRGEHSEQPSKQAAQQKKRKRPVTQVKTEKVAVDTKDSSYTGRRVLPRRAAKQD